MHKSEPDKQLKEGMDGNQACLRCHQQYEKELTAHTHHGSESSGSLCYNCHMPYTSYGLLRAIRSHQIDRPTVVSALQAKRPAVTHFRIGTVKPAPGDQIAEPNYRLLERAGLVKIQKGKEGAGLVTLTPQGEQVLAGISGIKKEKNRDGSTTYTVSLAERQLVQVSSVVMERPNLARVDYTWQWTPNALGDVFDATGPTAMKFNMWERGTLIQKYGADLFHAKPEKDALRVMHTDHGWIIPTE